MKEFIEAPRIIYKQAKQSGRLIEGLTEEEIRGLALRQDGVVETQMGSVATYSDPMSRAAPHTKNNIDHEFGENEKRLAEQAIEELTNYDIVSVDSLIGDYEHGHYKNGITARVIIPKRFAQIGYGTKINFLEPEDRVVESPTYSIVFFVDHTFERNKTIKDVRQKDITIRYWMGYQLGEQTKIVRNSSYFGEAKKGIFQFEDWRAKLMKEGIFMHAGIRRDRIWRYSYEKRDMILDEVVTGVLGLTATGKTTTLCRKLARLPQEKSEMIADDGGVFRFDGSFTGFERYGVYIKTEDLDHKQSEILRAATSRDAYLENVALSSYPYIPNFKDVSITRNGRAVVKRTNVGIASEDIHADRVDNIIILTRNPLMNVISKLTREQAVMQLIYGESIESSGGIEQLAGKFKREFFCDPFVVGNRREHAMIFYDFLKNNKHINSYLSNTGIMGYGNQEIDVTLRDSLSAYNDVLRGQLVFSNRVDFLGYYFPIRCDRANSDRLRAFERFEDKDRLRGMVKSFLDNRNEYLIGFESKYGRIDENIRESLRHEFSEKEFDETLYGLDTTAIEE